MIDDIRKSKAHIFHSSHKDIIEVVGSDYHHLTRVLRLKNNDDISVANNSEIRMYKISDIDKVKITARAIGEAVLIKESEIELAVSAFKLDRLEWGISKATEVGATRIVVGKTKRSTLDFSKKDRNKIFTRLSAIITNAAMQSRRAEKPEIIIVDDLIQYLNQSEKPIVICDPDGETNFELDGKTLVIGPEGGFEASEIELLKTNGQHVCLSPFILRSETAMAIGTAVANLGKMC